MMVRRTALVHDWLYTYAGAERVLEQILNVYPDADVFSLIDFVPKAQRAFLRGKTVRTSFIQHLPFAKHLYQKYLPLMPAAIEALDLRGYHLIISTSSAVAKGVLTDPSQLHVCYLQARNMRYLYDERFSYYGPNWLIPIQEVVLSPVRVWDAITAHRPNNTVANSQFVRRWYRHRYGVDSNVIYPPVDTELFARAPPTETDDYFVTVGRFEKYKQFPLIIEAFNRIGAKLVVIGDGSQDRTLRRAARTNISFTGALGPYEVAKALAGARALLYCAREDFGIVPVEAQAAGTPVIAFGEGGIAETVRGLGALDPTGVLFSTQSVEAIVDAVAAFEANGDAITVEACRRNADRFSIGRFRREFTQFIEKAWTDFQGN